MTRAGGTTPSIEQHQRGSMDMTAAALNAGSDYSGNACGSLFEKHSKSVANVGTSHSTDSLFNLLVRQVNEQINLRIEEAKSELAEDELLGIRKLHSSQVLTEEVAMDEEGEFKNEETGKEIGEEKRHEVLTMSSYSSKITQSMPKTKQPSSLSPTSESRESKKKSTKLKESKKDTNAPIEEQMAHLTRNAQRAHSLVQEDGPLSTRERQSLLSEFNRTQFSRIWSSASSLSDDAKSTLSDLATAYAHHILTRRRYRRATQWYKQTYEKLGSSYTSLKCKFKSIQQHQQQNHNNSHNEKGEDE